MAGPYLNTGPFKTRITDNDAVGPVEELGVWRFEAGKILRYVKSGSLIPAYEACKIDTGATATVALVGNQILQCDGPTNMFAGIAESTFANLSFGWVTVYGRATARVTSVAPGSALGPDITATGVLGIRNTSHFNAAAVAIQSGLSAGSAIFITVL